MKTYHLKINNNKYSVKVKEINHKAAKVEVNNEEHTVYIEDILDDSSKISPLLNDQTNTNNEKIEVKNIKKTSCSDNQSLKAPIPGQIRSIDVREGDKVSQGQKILILEAMKLENEINSHISGVIKNILVSVGDSVNQDQVMVEIGEC